MRRIIVLALALALVGIPAALAAGPRVAHANNFQTHIVKPGETLYGIAAMYGVSAQSIAQANKLVNPDYIYAGQSLVIPAGWAPPPPAPPPPPAGGPPPPAGCGHGYVVQPGDTMTSIALRHGTTVQAVAAANGVPYPYNKIYAGQTLYVPCGHGYPPPPPPPPHKPGHHKPAPPKPTAVPAKGLHPAACARQVQIVEPKQHQKVSGTLMIIGTANIPDFQFYKLEYAMGSSPLESDFHSIGEERHQAVTDGVLGTWYLGHMPGGDYVLRLTAVDNRGQFPQPCNVRIHIN
jgi:LysM repeat protein